jgi:hypothetical protein
MVDRCREEVPDLREVRPSRMVACHRADEVLAGVELSRAASATVEEAARGGTPS